MPGYQYLNRPRSQSPSKRWQTTMSAALDEVASQLKGSYDRNGMVKQLNDRKIANTKTSINFGNEKVNYLSDAMDNQIRCQGYISPEERAAQKESIRAMKAELTTTNFRLGDETPLYESVNHEAMARAETFRGVQRVAMNTNLKEAVKKSSIYFGNEPVAYSSVAHEAMEYKGNENNFSKLKQEVKEMKTTLTRHNFTFGDEKVDYVSDYHRGYGSLPAESYVHDKKKKDSMRAVIEDSRACHFTLGNDRPHYLSNTHSALRVIEGHSAQDVSKGIEHAKQMKAALQRTSIIIGDDEEYY
jgi:hypothetical protein